MSNKVKTTYRFGEYTFYLNSLKNDKMIWFESDLERDWALIKEFRKQIRRYLSQPVSFAMESPDGLLQRYTSDFFNQEQCGKLYFEEVKADEFARSPEFRELMAKANRHAITQHGAPVHVVLESEIRVGHRISNLEYLYKYQRVCLDEVPVDDILGSLDPNPTFGELKAHVADRKLRPVVPQAIVAHQHLWFDDTKPLNDQTFLERQL